MVIIDHNLITGAIEAQRFAPELVIVGEEIITSVSELLAALAQVGIPSGLTVYEAIGLLKDQGAFISISHLFDR